MNSDGEMSDLTLASLGVRIGQVCRALHCLLSYRIGRCICLVFSLLFYCEYVHYFIVIQQCSWPSIRNHTQGNITGHAYLPIKAMVIADTHLLGFREGHWLDKLRREWQMRRSFQTTLMLHSPSMVFLLGDVFDEGKWCGQEEFQYHVTRFRSMFSTSAGTDLQVVVGNHDVGFHYMMTKVKLKRFEKAFASPAVRLLEREGNIFILINSMTLEGDGCSMCQEAVRELKHLSTQLQCSQGSQEGNVCTDKPKLPNVKPIVMQHFPMYRPSDTNCSLPDSAPKHLIDIPFRERYDCLSKDATKLVLDLLKPRLILSGHTHHGCLHYHGNTIPEWSVSSFSWRYKNTPSFLMTTISPDDFEISQCYLPCEDTIIMIYICGAVLAVVCLVFPVPWRMRKISVSDSHKTKGE